MWARVRFTLSEPIEDYRPIKVPVLGPWWCSGHACTSDGLDENGDPINWQEYPVIVAYWPQERLEEIREFWPEFKGEFDFVQEKETIEFGDRFPKPDYWDAENNKYDDAYL